MRVVELNFNRLVSMTMTLRQTKGMLLGFCAIFFSSCSPTSVQRGQDQRDFQAERPGNPYPSLEQFAKVRTYDALPRVQ